MDKKLDDLLWKEPTVWQPPSGRNWNYEKIVALSRDEFAEFYFALMAEYRDDDKWWEKGHVICKECHQEIPGPEKLRRFYGNTLDPTCFLKVYLRERDNIEGVMQKYWDKVASLDK